MTVTHINTQSHIHATTYSHAFEPCYMHTCTNTHILIHRQNLSQIPTDIFAWSKKQASKKLLTYIHTYNTLTQRLTVPNPLTFISHSPTQICTSQHIYTEAHAWTHSLMQRSIPAPTHTCRLAVCKCKQTEKLPLYTGTLIHRHVYIHKLAHNTLT